MQLAAAAATMKNTSSFLLPNFYVSTHQLDAVSMLI